MRLGILGKLVATLLYFLFRVEVPIRAKIGKGLVLPHATSIVIGSAHIGDNVTIYQNVTLGARFFDGGYNLDKRPSLGDNSIIGAGAVVLGPVCIGNGAVVAANSLVLEHVPEGLTAIGVPARVLGTNE